MRVAIVAGLALLLTGCGQGGNPTRGADRGVTVEKDGTTLAINSRNCPRARFVPLYADAKVTTCVSAQEREKRGTIIYTSGATPAAVLAWYRAEAEKAGLKVSLQTDMNLSASEGKRTLMVMAMMQGSANQVTINWGE